VKLTKVIELKLKVVVFVGKLYLYRFGNFITFKVELFT